VCKPSKQDNTCSFDVGLQEAVGVMYAHELRPGLASSTSASPTLAPNPPSLAYSASAGRSMVANAAEGAVDCGIGRLSGQDR
jgi:hypothetical protein